MDTETKIYVSNDLGIVMARMQAREIARQMGFGTADQARFSLAASELARVLSWATREPSELVISNTNRNGHSGLQMACLVRREYLPSEGSLNGDRGGSVPGRSLAGACQLVDESVIEVETQNSEQARITLIKWLNGKDAYQ